VSQPKHLSPANAGFISVFLVTWGSASLHPRLYALACYAGLDFSDVNCFKVNLTFMLR